MYSNIIVTDLDGTFIDKNNYSAKVVAPIAKALIKRGVVFVFCSSKTVEEQRNIMDSIEISLPCIVENGSGIYLPSSMRFLSGLPSEKTSDGGRLICLGEKIEIIREKIINVSNSLGVDLKPYNNLSDQELSSLSGLDLKGVERARNRHFSETLTATLKPELWREIVAMFNQMGLHCINGSRYYTVSSSNKGIACKLLLKDIQSICSEPYRTIGIGDSLNDVDFLKLVDKAYLVQKSAGCWSEVDVPNIKRISAIGPQGWIKSIEDVLCI